LGGALRTVGHWLSYIGKPVGRGWDDVVSLFHKAFGSFGDVVLAILAVGLGGLIAWRLIRRRTRIGPQDTAEIEPSEREDAGTLEAAAAAAEAGGDLDASVRLRFRAGLSRLEDAGIIASRLVITTGQVRRTLRNATFDDLAERHETIAYAGKHATTADVVDAREGWPRVINEVGARP
jgi:hypothetical protein